MIKSVVEYTDHGMIIITYGSRQALPSGRHDDGSGYEQFMTT